jgi:hypothetical protein
MTEDEGKTTHPDTELEALRQAIAQLTDRLERLEERLEATSSRPDGAAAVRSVLVETAGRLRQAWAGLMAGAGAPPAGPGPGAEADAPGVARPAMGPVTLAATVLLALLAILVGLEIAEEISGHVKHLVRWLF